MSTSNSQVQKVVPIQLTDVVYNNVFMSMKENFAADMKRLDDEITRLSENMMNYFGQKTTVQIAPDDLATSAWTALANSPLVDGDGENMKLKLQFDVSGFIPSEVRVLVIDNKLVVTATHEEQTNNSSTYRHYHKEFALPQGINQESIVSSMTKDGILFLEAPIPRTSYKIK